MKVEISLHIYCIKTLKGGGGAGFVSELEKKANELRDYEMSTEAASQHDSTGPKYIKIRLNIC